MARRNVGGRGFDSNMQLPANLVTGTGTDERIARWDGVDALQSSAWSISDSGRLIGNDNHIIEIKELCYQQEKDDGTAAGGSTNINFGIRNHCRVAVTANSTLNLLSPVGNVAECQLKVTVTGSPVVTWTTATGALTWADPAGAPTFGPNNRRFCFFYFDSTNWFGRYTGLF